MDIFKAKKRAENSLQKFGRGLAKLTKRSPESRLRGAMKAYYEGGGGGRKPRLTDYK